MTATGGTRGLLVLGLGGLLIAGSLTALLFSQEAAAETQQTGTPLLSPTVSTAQADPTAKITPEQEAALVEVRKLLKEAWEVAEHIEMPSPLFTKKVTIKVLGEFKQRLLWNIEGAQLQAGEFTSKAISHDRWGGALALIQYGQLQEALQVAIHEPFSSPAQTLVVLKLLSDAGDLAGAMQVAEAQVRPGTGRGGPPRRQYEAELMAYLARRQAQAGNPEAQETMRRAEYAVRTNKNFQRFQFGGAVALGCAKAAMGDLTASAESFRQAINAAASIAQEEYKGEKASAVTLIGRAAAESGLKTVSQEAFQEALRLAEQAAEPHVRAKVMVKVAVSQSQGGDRIGGQRTLEEALTFARSLPDHKQRRRALGTIVEQQFEGGDPEGAAATLEHRRRWVETIADANEREAEIRSIQWWDAKLLPVQLAFDLAYAIQGDDEKQAKALASAAYILVHRHESMHTPEMLQRLSQTAAALLAKPLPADEKKADQYLSSLAAVQALVDGAAQAMQTLSRIKDSNRRKNSHAGLLSLLIQKRDLAGAKLMVGFPDIDDVGILSGGSGDTLGEKILEVAKIQAGTGDSGGALQWARQQKNSYAKAEAILGVGLGIMEREGLHNLRRQLSASIAIDKGARDTLTLGCAAL